MSTTVQESASATPPLDQRAALVRRRAELRARVTTQRAGGKALSALAGIDERILAFDSRLHAEQVENLVTVHEAMARLRACQTTTALIRAAPRELCDSCRFTRAMISRVQGSFWMPQVLEVKEGVEPLDADSRSYIEGMRIPLAHPLLEADLVRRRVAALVADPSNDPRTFQVIVNVAGSTSFVAAPIMPTGRVIGFLHADRYGAPDPVTASDRDMLWVFAEHFGLLFERLILMERLIEQRSRLADALARATSGIDDLYSDELELIRRGAPTRSRGNRRRPASSAVDALLTAREREILEVLATGATNAAVARALVLAEGTIKSHMKRIYRKLHVNNRAEAVAKFLHLVALDEERGR